MQGAPTRNPHARFAQGLQQSVRAMRLQGPLAARTLQKGTLHIRNIHLHTLVVSLQRRVLADPVVDELQAIPVLRRAVAHPIFECGVTCNVSNSEGCSQTLRLESTFKELYHADCS